MFRGKDTPQPNPDSSGMTAQGRARRKFLLKSGGAATGAGLAYINRGRIIDALVPDLPSLPNIDNPFDRETKVKTLEAAITGIRDWSRFISHVADVKVKVQVEKDAKYLDFLFDSKATGEVPCEAQVTCDFSTFFPPPPPEEFENRSLATAPVALEKPEQPQVGMVGGIPALVISDDLKTVTVTLANPELPQARSILPDFEKVRIKRGQGGLEDKIENWTGTSSIRDTEIYIAAQKAALQKLKEDPTIMPKAKEKISQMLKSLLSVGRFETINVNFIDPKAVTPTTQVARVPDPRAQARAGN